MAEKEVKVLYHWASPFVMRVVFALELKGIPYEIIEEDFSNKSQLLLDSNPVYKKVPVLIHNGRPLAESAIIVEYIDEAWPGEAGFFPRDPYARAQARFWGDFVEKKILQPMMQFVRCGSGANEEFIQSCITLEDALSKEDENPFLGPKTTTVGFADIMLLPFTAWIPAIVDELGLEMPGPEECPNLHRLFSELRDLPAAKVALPGVQKLREYIRSRVDVWRSS